MSLYLPPELSWLGWIAGGAWPGGDEDKVWAVSTAYKQVGEALRKLTPEIEGVKRASVSAYPEGVGRDKIGALFDQMLTRDQSMDSLAHFMDQITDATEDFDTSVQVAKLMTIVSLSAVEIAWAWAFPPTVPTASAVRAAEEVATQIAVRRLKLQIQQRIVAKVLSLAVGGRSESGAVSNYVEKSGSSSSSTAWAPSRAASSNLSVGGRGSSVSGGASDQSAGGPPDTRRFPGNDRSVSQPPKSGLQSSARSTADSNIAAGPSQRPSTSVSSMGSNDAEPLPRRCRRCVRSNRDCCVVRGRCRR
ncbi:hypothetical protein ACIA8C_12925 [Nocardia sp. NPDC051321]|uniref:WXG100-like domain-containing protein n=1 Tax=Nocardia sp. NPDC051321 TaxID=3364323 RepID=UPI0037917BF4